MKYRVTCYSPPSELKLADGDVVVAGGWAYGGKMRATSITNKTQKIDTCRCGQPGFVVEAYQEVTGKVSNITYDVKFWEFDLTEA
jgi:hypothetical protein